MKSLLAWRSYKVLASFNFVENLTDHLIALNFVVFVSYINHSSAETEVREYQEHFVQHQSNSFQFLNT